ncbi:hypothetical protein EFL35_05485 [Weissella paramesenteroides]|uniref:hypothetical protein n=1 Tax=Weissella paramesenteroides TaxID=1249 RepID=UPI00223BA078|nr:hypothetical protein [Weissella paramesenteroides]MCS9984422.1 hypothetical protein [Weissella paramesenteroides]MCS9999169.1 hypothetical protein [Weissella paramesenteroides]MCT0259654.1 hypothetical protein [Weissella paramesenteroides]
MHWLKSKKRQPPVDLGDYRAQVVKSTLDSDNPLIKQLLADTGQVTQTWPNLKLDELKTLTEKIQQNVAIATGEVVPLGDISFLTVDPKNPKKTVETGLTWENAVVRGDMENFVVETVNQVLNDEQVRLADDLTYQELTDALTAFLTASHELGGLTDQDLPTLPSEDEYIEAVEHNELFNRLPQRLVVRDEPTTDKPEQTVKSSQPQSETTLSEASSQAANDAEPASAVSQAATAVADAASVATQPVMPAAATADSTLTIAKLIQAFQVKTSFFKTKPLDEKQTVVPESDDYVDVMMVRETKEANVFMQQTADKVADAYRETLTQNIADVHEDTQAIDDLLTTDWQTPIKQQVTQRHTEDYGDRLGNSLAALDNDYQQAVAEEEQRHEQTLTKLEQQLATDKAKTTAKLTGDRDQIIQHEIAQIITTQKQYIEQEVQQLRYNQAEFKRHKVIDQIVAGQKEANDLMTKAYRQLSSDLEVCRQDFIKEHEHALAIREDSDKAQAEKERLQFANAEVLNLEKRHDQLKSVKMDLEGQIGQLQAESSKWQFRAETAQEDLERVKQQLVEVNQQYEHRLQSDQVDLAQHQELAQQARQAKLAKWLHPFKNRQKETKHVSQP